MLQPVTQGEVIVLTHKCQNQHISWRIWTIITNNALFSRSSTDSYTSHYLLNQIINSIGEKFQLLLVNTDGPSTLQKYAICINTMYLHDEKHEHMVQLCTVFAAITLTAWRKRCFTVIQQLNNHLLKNTDVNVWCQHDSNSNHLMTEWLPTVFLTMTTGQVGNSVAHLRQTST